MKTSSTSFAITVLAGLIAIAAAVMVPGCGNSVPALSSDGGVGSGGTTGGFGGFGGGIKIPIGMPSAATASTTTATGKVDYNDPECVGPLDNDESSFATGIPGDNIDACKQDCFFDGNSGMGDDGCDWQLKCDPRTNNAALPVRRAPTRSRTRPSVRCPRRSRASASTAAASWCRTAAIASAAARSRAPRRPSGWRRTCTAADFGDPTKCPPCTQVTQCIVPCERCEVCIGKPTIPADCNPYDGGVPDGGTPLQLPDRLHGVRAIRHRSRAVPRRHRLRDRLLPPRCSVTPDPDHHDRKETTRCVTAVLLLAHSR